MKPSFCFYLIALIAAVALLTNCKQDSAESVTPPDYIEEIRDWQQKRLRSLKSENGWLSLAGLYWLNEGENTFGADSANAVIFPKGKAPAFMGKFILDKGEVFIEINPGIEVLFAGKPLASRKIFGKELVEPTVLSYGSLSWFIIQRGNKFGIRLRDSENPAIRRFQGIESYPIDPRWKVEAQLEPYEPPKTVPIQNVLGMMTNERSPGVLAFDLDGRTYRLEALEEADELFIIFSDETSGNETYGLGRYLYTRKPGSDGMTILDFNKAYSPPCAFTEFATCPLPPAQNHLPIKITAGEKYHGTH